MFKPDGLAASDQNAYDKFMDMTEVKSPSKHVQFKQEHNLTPHLHVGPITENIFKIGAPG